MKVISKSVLKIREIKNRDSKPFSVIAPNKQWIKENCSINDLAFKWIKKLPGKYTLILKINNKDCICKETNNSLESLGVRIPNNWFANIIEELNIPFVTTSVNLSGESPATDLDNMNKNIKNQVDYIIYKGKLENNPSTLINTLTDELIIR